ncbi:MAG: succinate dehydrogenase assembly factor 2 [Ponticaulis sp.]|nr:succinate dehydrogenase assembly factor 2 [Ponticaulis sp.]|tara:strand:+ start:48989 stop:49249 length:261 start_codon:yes stop_codon:yes gene_type:complete
MDERRRKLHFRAWRRGIRELDLIFGSFSDAHMANLTDSDLDEFERLLDVPDLKLYDWITGTAETPAEYQSNVLDQLKQFKYSAQPG